MEDLGNTKYKTLSRDWEYEELIEKSRFIVTLRCVESRQQADDYLKLIKDRYKDATHNVPAFIIGEKQELKWATDDGEPQGTAGAPILSLLEKEGITDVLVVVTRYFGGVKLGTGGLVRAYAGTVKRALEETGISVKSEKFILSCRTGYSEFNKLRGIKLHRDYSIENIKYTDFVEFDFMMPINCRENAESIVKDIFSGNVKIISSGNIWIKTAIEEMRN